MRASLALMGGAAVLALAAAPAAAGEYVTWHDDGTVDLVMEDGTTLKTSRDELGGLFGPDQKPFEGTEISITVNSGGPKGGISGPMHSFRPIWEELSGGKLNIVELPFAEHYTKMMLDLRNGTGQYDAFMVGAFWYGDIVPAGYAYAIDELMDSGDFPSWTYDDMPPSLKALYTWKGEGFGTLNDADGQVLYYRKSVLENPEHQAAFKQEYGYDLPSPPKTWQQLLDISRHFNGKNWDANDSEADSGTVLHLKVGEQGHYHFQSLSASFAVTPGEKVDRTHNVYWFDPIDMKPLINSPGHLRALEFLQELHGTGPSAQVGWSLGEAWDYFLRGKAVFVFSWGDVGALCQDTTRSNIQGDCAAAVLPMSDEYYDMEKKSFVKAEDRPQVGNTTGGSWHGVISNFSANPEATYSFLSLMAIRPASMWNAQHGWTGVDPGYSYQFLEEQGGTAKIEDYVDAGWSAEDASSYLQAYRDNFYAPTMLTYLRIPGTFEYWDILDKNLSAAMSGAKTAKEALDDTATSWEQVTERIGREKQIEDYQAAIGFEG
ncbi:extracellular solute-binding protein [Marinimicrococcus flavescens]|uniref:Extracellular solute-binding protein n=1 Tax=Marinimicrococcus flavescens TaxID=3031815 RepID=A0AAP3XQW7_9PROT|nr:extracellular solute-binding protein [Marinimicrococcus flavescens]